MKFDAVPGNLQYLLFGSSNPGGLVLTIILAAVSLIIAFPFGVVIGIMRVSPLVVVRLPSLLFIELIRATPLLLLLFWTNFLIPSLIGMTPKTSVVCIAAFVVFTSAYIAEIVRAGIQAIPNGQIEAARGSGMTSYQTMRYIVCPQALRNMLPSLVNQFVSLSKDTSLAGMFGVMEMFRCAKQISDRSLNFDVMLQIYAVALLVYFVICFCISRAGTYIESVFAQPSQ